MRGALATVAAFLALTGSAGAAPPTIANFHVTAGEHETFVAGEIYGTGTSWGFRREWSPCQPADESECPAVAFIEEIPLRPLGAIRPAVVRLAFRVDPDCEYLVVLEATNADGTVYRGGKIRTPGAPTGGC